MNRFFNHINRNRREFAAILTLVFLAGWLSFASYLYTNQVLIIPITGEIVDFQDFALALHYAKLDRNVKSVVLYLNTPGGYADACLEIAEYVKKLSVVKPVIASMGPFCASGGYYIASFARSIFTHNNTLTGSIGVIAVWVDMSQYYETQGINITVWATGSEKDIGADWRPPTKEEYDRIGNSVNATFQKLLTDIQQNRNLSSDTLNTIKTGTTFSGTEAVQLGLADNIGNIVDAVEEAARQTGMWKFIIVSSDMDERSKFIRALF